MACESWQVQLAAYVDGELSPPEATSVGKHLRECADCARETIDQVKIKRSVAAAGKLYTPSAQFRAKIMKSAGAKPRAERWWLWRLVAAPAALLVLISLGVNLYVNHAKGERAHVYSELADLHVSTLASASQVDVISTDRHTVKPWFEGKLPFTFNLPELQGTDFTLLGGKVTYLAQAPGAQLIYKIRKHELSVFIFQDRGEGGVSSSSGATSQFSFNVESWTQNGLRYFVIGDVGVQDVESLSKLLRDAG
jgi:anti-sigma factor RsiW